MGDVQLKKIAILSSFADSIFNFRMNIIDELILKGYAVWIISPRFSADQANILHEKGVQFVNVEVEARSYNVFKLIGYFVKVFIALRRIRPNVTLSYSFKANFVNVLCSKILFINSAAIVTGLGKVYILEPENTLFKVPLYLLRLLLGRTLGAANLLVFQNPHDESYFLYKNYTNDRNQTFLMNGSGIDTSYYQLRPIKNYKTVLLIARLIEAKGIREFCLAVAELGPLVDWRYQVVGWEETGSDAISPLEINNLSNGKVEYLGSTRDVRSYIYEATFIILPAYREGLARSLLEAMACGRPILMSNAPGMVELHDAKYSFLFCPKNYWSICDTLVSLRKLSEREIDLMGKYARNAVIKKYDARSVAQAFVTEIGKI